MGRKNCGSKCDNRYYVLPTSYYSKFLEKNVSWNTLKMALFAWAGILFLGIIQSEIPKRPKRK